MEAYVKEEIRRKLEYEVKEASERLKEKNLTEEDMDDLDDLLENKNKKKVV